METNNFPYHITIREFSLHDQDYRVALTPVLINDGEGLDFTGAWHILLISSEKGTRHFILEPDPDTRWVSNNALPLEPGLLDVLDNIIQQLRNNA